MFLKGLLFGAGWTVGMLAVVGLFMGLSALSERFMPRWKSENERHLPENPADQAERVVARRERMLLLLRIQDWAEEPMESADRKTTYIQ